MGQEAREAEKIKLKIRELSIIIPFALVLAIVVFLVLYGETLGFDSSLGTDLVMIVPGLVLTIIAALVTASLRGFYTIPGCGVIGISLAFLFGQLETQGYITLNLLTVPQVQFALIVFGFVVGGILTAILER